MSIATPLYQLFKQSIKTITKRTAIATLSILGFCMLMVLGVIATPFNQPSWATGNTLVKQGSTSGSSTVEIPKGLVEKK